MDSILRFGSGDELYEFEPEDQISLRDNFRDAVPRTTRLPGVSGGFDEFGSDPAPGEIGNVQVNIWIQAETEDEMTRKLQDIGSMPSFGVKRLFKRPMNGDPELYCNARINSIDYTGSARNLSHRNTSVQINFQVATPGWLSQGTESPLWGGGELWGGGAVWGGGALPVTVIGLNNDFSIEPGGNGVTYPRIFISIPTLKSATNVRVQRIVGGIVKDEIRYDDTLSAGDVLEVNARALSVMLNNVDAYDDKFTFKTAGWFSLIGGISNTIRVLMDNPSDEARITTKYFEVIV